MEVTKVGTLTLYPGEDADNPKDFWIDYAGFEFDEEGTPLQQLLSILEPVVAIIKEKADETSDNS